MATTIEKLAALVCAGALALSACGEGTDGSTAGTGDPEGKSDQPVGDGELIATQNSALVLNKGYHALFDATANTCVDPVGSSAVQVVDMQDRFDLVYVTSREQLAGELGVDLSLKVAHTLGSGNASAKLLSTYAQHENSVHVLLTVQRSYLVQNKNEVDLSERAISKLEDGANEFMQACGANYVSGVRHGAFLRLLVIFTAKDTESKQELEASIGAESSLLDVGGTFDTMLKASTEQEGATLSVVAVRGGMDAQTEGLATLIEKGISAETLGQIGEIENSLARSVRTDACHDSSQCAVETDGLLKCQPCDDAPNYFDNSQRNGAVLGAHVGSYGKLFSSSSRFKPVYDQIRDHWHAAEGVTRDVSAAREQLEAVHLTELRPFLNATPAEQASYNVREGEPATTADELRAIADAWDNEFHPERGTLVTELSDHAVECWGKAAEDIDFDCAAIEASSGKTAAALISEANERLDEYKRTSRITPIAVRDPRSFENEVVDAKDTCRDHITPRGSYVLPTPAEAALIAPLLDGGEIFWPVGMEQTIFVDSDECSGQGLQAVYTLSASGGVVSCEGKADRATVCVAAAGPFVD